MHLPYISVTNGVFNTCFLRSFNNILFKYIISGGRTEPRPPRGVVWASQASGRAGAACGPCWGPRAGGRKLASKAVAGPRWSPRIKLFSSMSSRSSEFKEPTLLFQLPLLPYNLQSYSVKVVRPAVQVECSSSTPVHRWNLICFFPNKTQMFGNYSVNIK